MIPREKAKELVEKFSKHSYNKTKDAKQCALIAVEELTHSECEECGKYHNYLYWEEVKQEIHKMK